MSCLGPGFSDSRDFEMALDEVGKRITVDLYFGVMKNGDEKMMEARKASRVTRKMGFRHLIIKLMKLAELKSP
jgi:hypothetical protein